MSSPVSPLLYDKNGPDQLPSIQITKYNSETYDESFQEEVMIAAQTIDLELKSVNELKRFSIGSMDMLADPEMEYRIGNTADVEKRPVRRQHSLLGRGNATLPVKPVKDNNKTSTLRETTNVNNDETNEDDNVILKSNKAWVPASQHPNIKQQKFETENIVNESLTKRNSFLNVELRSQSLVRKPSKLRKSFTEYDEKKEIIPDEDSAELMSHNASSSRNSILTISDIQEELSKLSNDIGLTQSNPATLARSLSIRGKYFNESDNDPNNLITGSSSTPRDRKVDTENNINKDRIPMHLRLNGRRNRHDIYLNSSKENENIQNTSIYSKPDSTSKAKTATTNSYDSDIQDIYTSYTHSSNPLSNNSRNSFEKETSPDNTLTDIDSKNTKTVDIIELPKTPNDETSFKSNFNINSPPNSASNETLIKKNSQQRPEIRTHDSHDIQSNTPEVSLNQRSNSNKQHTPITKSMISAPLQNNYGLNNNNTINNNRHAHIYTRQQLNISDSELRNSKTRYTSSESLPISPTKSDETDNRNSRRHNNSPPKTNVLPKNSSPHDEQKKQKFELKISNLFKRRNGNNIFHTDNNDDKKSSTRKTSGRHKFKLSNKSWLGSSKHNESDSSLDRSNESYGYSRSVSNKSKENSPSITVDDQSTTNNRASRSSVNEEKQNAIRESIRRSITSPVLETRHSGHFESNTKKTHDGGNKITSPSPLLHQGGFSKNQKQSPTEKRETEYHANVTHHHRQTADKNAKQVATSGKFSSDNNQSTELVIPKSPERPKRASVRRSSKSKSQRSVIQDQNTESEENHSLQAQPVQNVSPSVPTTKQTLPQPTSPPPPTPNQMVQAPVQQQVIVDQSRQVQYTPQQGQYATLPQLQTSPPPSQTLSPQSPVQTQPQYGIQTQLVQYSTTQQQYPVQQLQPGQYVTSQPQQTQPVVQQQIVYTPTSPTSPYNMEQTSPEHVNYYTQQQQQEIQQVQQLVPSQVQPQQQSQQQLQYSNNGQQSQYINNGQQVQYTNNEQQQQQQQMQVQAQNQLQPAAQTTAFSPTQSNQFQPQPQPQPSQSLYPPRKLTFADVKTLTRPNAPMEFTDSAFGFPLPSLTRSTVVMFDYRLPIGVERAIYRLSHLKLSEPKRTLRQQVLLSNFMYAYLHLVNHTLYMEKYSKLQSMNSLYNGSWNNNVATLSAEQNVNGRQNFIEGTPVN